jgi:hypothetical protein
MEFLQIKLTIKPPTEDKRQNRELYLTAQLKSVGTFMEAIHWHFSISCYFCYMLSKIFLPLVCDNVAIGNRAIVKQELLQH